MNKYELVRLEQRDLIGLIDGGKLVLVTRCQDCKYFKWKQIAGTNLHGICKLNNVGVKRTGYCDNGRVGK